MFLLCSDFRWISSWFVRRRKSAIRDNSVSSFDPLKKEPVFSTDYPFVESYCLPSSEDMHSKENLLPTFDESFCKHGPLCSACPVDPTVLFHRKLSRASYMHSTPFASAHAPNVMLMPPLPPPPTAAIARDTDSNVVPIGSKFRTVPPAESPSLGYIPAAFPMDNSLASSQPHQNFSCCPPDGPGTSTSHHAFANAPALHNNNFMGSEQFIFTYTRQSFVPLPQPDDTTLFDGQVPLQDLRLPARHFDDQFSLPHTTLGPPSSQFYEPQMPDVSAVTKDLPFSERDWKALGFADLDSF
ncbi:hypothetical protein BD410DRAFT_787580 [Rickenella mellea]|uniref:Uncharacterized protein n=1 Tax=Rickenella mellea TaxID=50990 RepID=A0A4Y7Q8U8_9AGAM|nr:hypothetical protein BD410DRAFT_787580 [Rickenella mellea]